MTCCCCDGESLQLSVIVEENFQISDEVNVIIIRKHSASCTAVGQSCDAGPVFRSINAISKSITKEDSSLMVLKLIVKNVLVS